MMGEVAGAVLLWCALPLVVAPVAGRRGAGRGLAAILLAGFALAALQVGAGSLAPAELKDLAAASPGDARFIGITLGVLIVAAMAGGRDGAPWGVPLLIGAVLSLTGGALPWSALGAVLAAVPPLLLSRWVAPTVATVGASLDPARVRRGAALLIGIILVVNGDLLAAALLAVAAAMVLGSGGATAASRAWRLVPTAGLLALVAWTGIVVAAAGSPFRLTVGRLLLEVPIGVETGITLGLLVIIGVGLLLGPWPLGGGVAEPWMRPLLVLAVGPFVRASTAGIGHWLPVATLVVVLLVAVAVVRRGWRAAWPAVAFLGVLRPGDAPLAGALLLTVAAAWPAVSPRPARIVHTAAAVGAALVVAAVLGDEVLLATLLTAVLVAGAVRDEPVTVVAPA